MTLLFISHPMAPIVNSLLIVLFIFTSLLSSSFSIILKYPAIINFGDSNSDTGNLISAGIESVNPPYGQNYFKRPSGRYCDGRLTIDFLLDAMDMPFLNPYLDSLGLPNFKKGCNFAAAGSTILPAKPTSVSPFSFDRQISQFIRFKSRSIELLAEPGMKYERYLPPIDSYAKGLYMIDIGQNDIAGAFYCKTLDQVIAFIPSILETFEAGLKRLYQEGGRNFWIHNTGPLGCLAQNIAKFGKDTSKLDKFGCVSSHNQAAKLFNLQLHALSNKFQAQFPDSNVTYVDIFSIKSNLIANYSQFGFENPIMVCCGIGGTPLNYDRRISCGQTKGLNGTTVTAKACNDSSEFVNWDGIHYTEAANHFVSNQILTGKYSDPPFSDQMPFLLSIKF